MLPPESKYSLAGQAKSKASSTHDTLGGERHALVLRLSRQALDALDVQPAPTVEVDFDSQPGLFINGVFFPFSSQTESVRHELYSRTANKPQQLKSAAIISGKLTVDPVLDNRLKDKMQQSTLAAHNEKQGRSTKFIDTPPALASAKQTKKKSQPLPNSMFMKANTSRPIPADLPPRPPPMASTSSAPPSTDRPANIAGVKPRLIRFLARKDRTIEEAFNFVIPNSDAALKQQVQSMIDKMCHPISDPKKNSESVRYRLRKEVFKDVRPFEWPNMGEAERLNLARIAQRALTELGIKPTDPRWKHVTLPSEAATAPPPPALSTTPSSSSHASKHPVQQVEVKEKTRSEARPRAKALPLGEKQSDPSQASPSIHSPTKSTISATVARKAPGSGYKLPKQEEPISRLKAERPIPEATKSASRVSDPAPVQRVKRLKEESDSERSRAVRDASRRESSISDRESREGTLKRKKPIKEEEDDDDEPLSKQKRRKTGEGVNAPFKQHERRDVSATHARAKTMKDDSPAPIPGGSSLPKKPPRPVPIATPMAGPSPSKVSNAARTRRRDLTTYTSSEDEGEISWSSTKQRRSPGPLLSPPTTNTSTSSKGRGSGSRQSVNAFPRDSKSQRKMYRKLWGKYLNTHGRLVQQRQRVTELLGDIDDSRSSVSTSDDDGDVRLLEYDELKRLQTEHSAYVSELMTLKEMIAADAMEY